MRLNRNDQKHHSLNQLPDIHNSDYTRMTLRAAQSMNKINVRGSMVTLRTSRLNPIPINNLLSERSS